MDTLTREEEKWQFLSEFSEDDYRADDETQDSYVNLLPLYDRILPYVEAGDYMDLYGSTGVMAAFFTRFSPHPLVPHGMDIYSRSISLARRNNPEYADNFTVGDYLAADVDFARFGTVTLDIMYNDLTYTLVPDLLTKYLRLFERIRDNFPRANFIPFCSGGAFPLQSVNVTAILDFLEEQFSVVHTDEAFLVLRPRDPS